VKHKFNRSGLLILTFLLGIVTAFAQTTAPQDVSGTYEGMVKRPGATTEDKVSLELKSAGGKITGRATHGDKTAEVTDGKLENGTLTLKFGNDVTFVAKLEGDMLVGEAVHGADKVKMELKRVTPTAATPAAAATPAPAAAPATAAPAAAATPAPAAAPATAAPAAAGPVNLSGEWDAVADANGQPFPFLLVLKVEGENVTGSSSSQLGDATIKTGTWKDGKLVLQVEGQNGVISLNATVVEGKLSGEFDYAGQLQGKWTAVKKK
jgi:hypothetical protein